jgi:NAD dependent epimerase/dehydratase family enzyme
MPQRIALIAGATGLVGSLCLKQLLDDPDYAQVISISRRPASESHPKLVQKLVDFDNLSHLAPIAANDAFCALGTTNLLWQEARNNSHWCRRWAQTLVRGLFISARKANSKK